MAVESRARHKHDGCRRKAQRNTKHHGIPHVIARIGSAAGPKGTCDGRDKAAADRALRDGNDQRNQRKDRRDTSQGLDACA